MLLFKAICFSLTILIPWLYISKKNNNLFFNTIIYLPIILAFSYGTAIRPQIFTYLFFSITLFLLEYDGLKTRLSYIAFPLMFIVWVNSHGGVMAGLALVCFYAIYQFIFSNLLFENKKLSLKFEKESLKLFIIPLILFAVLIINPYFYKYYPYIVDAISMQRPFVEEWGSLFETMANFTYLNILVLITSIFIILNLRYLTVEKAYSIILILLMMYLALNHVRHIPFFAIVCAFYLPCLISCLLEKEDFYIRSLQVRKDFLAYLFIAISLILIVISFIKDGKISYNLETNIKSTPQYVGYPVNTVDFIKRNNLKGNIITNFNWGEYIIYNLYPDIKVSFDGRYETVYPDNIVKDNLLFISGQPGWRKVLTRFNPDMVLVSKYDPVVYRMAYESGWPIVYKDLEGFLFVNPQKINFKTLK
ncbi:MAG: hypothetical protein AB1782_03990 [Cyanobacteriota bacterium]